MPQGPLSGRLGLGLDPGCKFLKEVSRSVSLVIPTSSGKKGFFSVTGYPELGDDSLRGVTHEAEVRAPTREVMSLWPLRNVLKGTRRQKLRIVLPVGQTQTAPCSPK